MKYILLVALTLVPLQDRKRLSVVTYNVLGDAVETKRRFAALSKILRESDADIIALQEVVPWFTALLSKEDWVKGYQTASVKPEEAGGQFLLSRLPIHKAATHKLTGPQGRQVLVATLKLGDRSIDIATTHLESPLESGKVRAKQLEALFQQIKAEDALVLGDFNFGDGEPEDKIIDSAWVDAWKALRPKEAGYTWDIDVSDMARKGSFPGEKSRRLDRVLVRSRTWKAKDVAIVGDVPIIEGKKDLFPSDHFGLRATFARD